MTDLVSACYRVYCTRESNTAINIHLLLSDALFLQYMYTDALCTLD